MKLGPCKGCAVHGHLGGVTQPTDEPSLTCLYGVQREGPSGLMSFTFRTSPSKISGDAPSGLTNSPTSRLRCQAPAAIKPVPFRDWEKTSVWFFPAGSSTCTSLTTWWFSGFLHSDTDERLLETAGTVKSVEMKQALPLVDVQKTFTVGQHGRRCFVRGFGKFMRDSEFGIYDKRNQLLGTRNYENWCLLFRRPGMGGQNNASPSVPVQLRDRQPRLIQEL